jgi:predicted dehydrogenase
MSTDTVQYGVIGCAGVGNTHAEAAQAAEGAQLVACADVDPEAASEFAENHGVPAQYTDIAEMIEDADVDAVSVCTPSGTHADVTVEAVGAGAHVLCEKPLDVYAERINRMIEAAEDAGVILAGVFQKRFGAASQRAKEAVEEELGDVVLADTTVKWFRSQEYYDSGGWRGTRDMDGGCLMNQGIHNIDRLQWLAGDVVEVRAITDTLHRDLECETVGALALRFENGAVGTIEATTVTKGGRDRTEINGTQGSLALAGSDIDYFETAVGEGSQYGADTESRDVEVEPSQWGDGHAAAVADFVEAIAEGREPAVPAREARKAVDVILAAYESAETGAPVRPDSFR